MIDNHEFIYSLLYNGHVFYIGRCKNAAIRYQAHISSARHGATRNARFIQTILDKGDLPYMKIINYLPKKEAAELEKMLVTSITNGGQMLTNCSYVYNDRWYSMWPKNMPSKPTRTEMLTIVRYLEDHQIHWKNFENGTRCYRIPSQPFTK